MKVKQGIIKAVPSLSFSFYYCWNCSLLPIWLLECRLKGRWPETLLVTQCAEHLETLERRVAVVAVMGVLASCHWVTYLQALSSPTSTLYTQDGIPLTVVHDRLHSTKWVPIACQS